MIKAEDQTPIKVTDLRIGNLVQYKAHDGTIQPIKVDSIGSGGINLYAEEIFVAGPSQLVVEADLRDSDISGIELNEEWLIKLGFEHSGDYYVKDQVYIMIKSYLEPRQYHYKFNYACIDILYVHQAQNLYHSLTGTELTLKT